MHGRLRLQCSDCGGDQELHPPLTPDVAVLDLAINLAAAPEARSCRTLVHQQRRSRHLVTDAWTPERCQELANFQDNTASYNKLQNTLIMDETGVSFLALAIANGIDRLYVGILTLPPRSVKYAAHLILRS